MKAQEWFIPRERKPIRDYPFFVSSDRAGKRPLFD
jgi:hypothetical protein